MPFFLSFFLEFFRQILGSKIGGFLRDGSKSRLQRSMVDQVDVCVGALEARVAILIDRRPDSPRGPLQRVF